MLYMTYQANPSRYATMPYRTCGRSGLKLPAVSLGLWHNFGDATPMENQRAMLRTAFDLGITHFDLANNYGPPTAAPRPILASTCGAISNPTATNSSSPAKRGGTCGPARTAQAAVPANI